MTQDQALSILKTGANAFLTGEPGSGKSFLVNRYVPYLKAHKIDVAVTASTGIAATHIGGMTIHSWSGIGIKKDLSPRDLLRIANRDYLAKRIKRTKVLIIDEISMLESRTLDAVDLVCRKVRGEDCPFGGLQVVLVGDFFQLPPVAKEGETAQFAFESGVWQDLEPTICYLSEQHRQEDESFLALLSGIRRGEVEQAHIDRLMDCLTTEEIAKDGITKLFSHNIDVDRINNRELEKLPGESKSSQMVEKGKKTLTETLKKSCLSPQQLLLKKDAVVMFTKNNPKEGFVNGTLGRVAGFDRENGLPIVKTRSGRTIGVPAMDWTIEENDRVLARITQLPLRLAWAITIHKSQGMSLDAAVMNLDAVFEFGQGYVALSRVRSFSGLFLLGANDQALLVHPDILAHDKEFREMSCNAAATHSSISENELKEKYDQFILRCEGVLKAQNYPKTQPAEKISTADETLLLFRRGKNIAEIAQSRGLKEVTIVSHLEKLAAKSKISKDEVKKLLPRYLSDELNNIHGVFNALDTLNLSPVFEKFNGKYSYYDLRLARMVLE